MPDVGPSGRRNGDSLDGFLASPIIGYFGNASRSLRNLWPRGMWPNPDVCFFTFLIATLLLRLTFSMVGVTAEAAASEWCT